MNNESPESVVLVILVMVPALVLISTTVVIVH
eukprot:CAMPEP_0118953048 /NCGR_PEP_ID=MMETSP1169-20130426/55859_1 /TAXON_ID=36882 /ORGANISM="Pyramimonas obovata, Strain CCMP722" /LENGTH=31 /DNA_ID= /DNA_START= /DNA_END= /DNA_ORIENTATION=